MRVKIPLHKTSRKKKRRRSLKDSHSGLSNSQSRERRNIDLT